ncbi:hypothetical protein [Vibrio hepatarius]|uniref:hypothetical protein n=1 Tax=Vibrio hepatarius TaxID=171383 RepID=UPI00148DA850|nr:hypothetical protein [Vibrio hepatarius]NOI16377.1 hypothetical protein [Vibrio hepatarius]
MMKKVRVERDKQGFWTHPQLPEWDESTTFADSKKWFSEKGLDCALVIMDGDLGEQWGNGEIDSCLAWEPEINIQDAYLVGIWDTEDGVVAMFAFPQIILEDSDKAAEFKTDISGWVSSDGRFYGKDERLARYAGSTHRKCDCGNIIPKNSYCNPCAEKRTKEKFLAMPVVAWDGASYIYDENTDKYFSNPEELVEHYAVDDLDSSSAMLIVCKPNYARQIEDDFWCDDLPEDISFDECGGVEQETISLLNKLNEKLKTTVLSYSPGDQRLDQSLLF